MSSQGARARTAFLDSSGFLALVNPHDARHGEARQALSALTENRWRTVTTNFVVAETHALFLARLGRQHADAFLRQMEKGSTSVVRVSSEDERLARSIIFDHADKDYSLTDALSFVVMERQGIRHALAFDIHFRQYGLITLGPSTP